MSAAIDKLVAIASDALMEAPVALGDGEGDRSPSHQLAGLLSRRNGFYAFESALHVFPQGRRAGIMDLETWNSDSFWRDRFGAFTLGCFFFAEDIFCNQFCLRGSKVCVFDPETARIEELAPDIEAWARLVLDDYRVLTGWPLAHEWQVRNGTLPPGKRLAPTIPFLLGGAYELDNLWACDAIDRMNICAEMYAQIGHASAGDKRENCDPH